MMGVDDDANCVCDMVLACEAKWSSISIPMDDGLLGSLRTIIMSYLCNSVMSWAIRKQIHFVNCGM
jgi:hypothetical protein